MTLHQVIRHQLEQLHNLEETFELIGALIKDENTKVIDLIRLCETLATIEKELSDEILDWLSSMDRYTTETPIATKCPELPLMSPKSIQSIRVWASHPN